MSLSAKAQTISKYYDLGVWSIAKVKDAVRKGWITRAEFREITGQEYSE